MRVVKFVSSQQATASRVATVQREALERAATLRVDCTFRQDGSKNGQLGYTYCT
jgi:hypothetical protein